MEQTIVTKTKLGMYGETDKVNIGKFTIRQLADKEGETRIWIQDNEADEGGEFEGKDFEKSIEDVFNKLF